MVLLYRPIVTLYLKCTVFEIWRHIGRKSPKNLPNSHLARSLGWPLANFSTSHTLPGGWSDGAHFTILLSICWTQYRLTDGQTRCCRKDRAMHSVARVKTSVTVSTLTRTLVAIRPNKLGTRLRLLQLLMSTPAYRQKPPTTKPLVLLNPVKSKLPSFYCECSDREKQINSSRCILRIHREP